MTKLHLPNFKLPDWPRRDRGLWLAARQPAGPFDEAGFAADWRSATVRSTEKAYGVYLAWLETTRALDPDAAPMDRVDRKRIEAFIDAYMPGRAETTIAGTVRSIAYVLRATNPPDGLPWLTRMAHRMMNTATPSRPKLPRMASIAELVDLGARLMLAAWGDLQERKVGGALSFRNGLMIASLAERPMLRLRNLAGLRLGHSLLRDAAGVRVRFLGSETKKGRQIDFHYPDWLTKPFDVYVNDVRPALSPRIQGIDDGWLWIGMKGGPLQPNNITAIVTGITMRHLGRPISPHLIRDCAATDIALIDPAHVGITRSVLGHATLASSQRSYNQATSYSAVGRLGAVITGLKGNGEELCN